MNDAIDYLIVIVLVVTLPFPLIFAWIKQVNHPVLFISAAYGLELVVSICLIGMAIPIWVLMIYVVPQLETNGVSLHWITYLSEFVRRKGMYLITPLIYIAGTILLYRAYPSIFCREYDK